MEFNAKDRRLEGDTILRQCQLTELYLLDVFVEICEKYNLTYFLESGTLLGAARHGGFIPWDDDIDVGMPIGDYKKFLKIAPKELPNNLLVTPGKYKEGYCFAKLRDCSSFLCERETDVRQPCGIYIDIFPYVKIPVLPFRFGRFLSYWAAMATHCISIHLTLCHCGVFGMLLSACKVVVWKGVRISIQLLHFILGLLLPTRWRYKIGIATMCYHKGFVEETLFPTSEIEFEGSIYRAPHNVNGYLTQVYGNWRELPPEDKRHWHASIICPTQAPDAPWARKYVAKS